MRNIILINPIKFFTLLLFIFLLNCSCLSQEVIRKEKLKVESKGQTILLNTSNPKIALFDKNSVTLVPIDSSVKKSTYYVKGFLYYIVGVPQYVKRLDKKNIVGYSVTNNSDFTFYVKSKKRYLEFLLLRSSNNTHNYGRINFKFPDDDDIVSIFSTMNNFYVVTITKNSSTLNCYEFNAVYLKDKWSIDLSDEFQNSSLHDLLISKFNQQGTINLDLTSSITTVENPLELDKMQSIQLTKIFIDKSNLHFTLDSDERYTRLISISIPKKDYSITNISYPTFCFTKNNHNTNSFFAGNRLFNFRFCPDALALKVSSLDGGTLKQLEISSEYESWSKTPLYGDEYMINKTMSSIISYLSECIAGIVVNTVGNDAMISLGGRKSLDSSEIKPGKKAYSEGWLLFPLFFEDLTPKKANAKSIFDDYVKYAAKAKSSSFQKTFQLDDQLYYSYYDEKQGVFTIATFK